MPGQGAGGWQGATDRFPTSCPPSCRWGQLEDFIRSISTGLTGLVGHRIWFFLVTTDRDLNFSREIPIRDRPQCQCSTDTISTNNRHLCSLIISVRTGSRYKTNGSCLGIKYNLIPTDKNNNDAGGKFMGENQAESPQTFLSPHTQADNEPVCSI